MKNGILIIVLLLSGFAFSQTTINLENQCNCEIIKGTEVTNAGATVNPADLGDIYVNTDTGVLYFWDGDSWELTSGSLVRNVEFKVDKVNKKLILIDSEGKEVEVSFADISAEINTDEQELSFSEETNKLAISNGNEVDLSSLDDSAVIETLDGRVTANENAIGALEASVAANTNAIAANATNISNNTDAISENEAAIGVLETSVETNTSAISENTAAITTNTEDITSLQNEKEDASNKSDDTALGTSSTLFPTQNAVKTYVDNSITASEQTVVSVDEGNSIKAGTDGGAFYDDSTLQTSVATNTNNIATNAENISDNTDAIADKEDASNKSTDGTLS
ncbi:hypothetical protein, partial [Joostella sp. CR20]|uniref:hypothetical protein n=1 Tax=Joostella sp. CR20 TaxID=2804312 RepID=UPI00313B29ED